MCSNIRLVLKIFVILLFCGKGLSGQNKFPGEYRVVFYNAENLFDPFDDPATNDNEYTPTGKSHWTFTRLNHKVNMVYRAIISASNGHFPDIIGLAEIENLWTLEYLIKNTPLKEGNYGIIHKESPDPRGIDVALLYRKESVKPVDYDFIPVHSNGSNRFSSRDVLLFKAKLNSGTVCFLVNHWPSRSGGYVETLGKRDIAARIVRHSLDSLMKQNPDSKFLLMGDFNATPDESCFTKVLGASLQPERSNSSYLVNLAQSWLRKGMGTIRTKGHWEIFDQFICSYNLLHGSNLQIIPSKTIICTENFLMEEDKRYLGKKPFRTYLGPVYHGGVSDHLPISTVIMEKAN
jgi:hypothetical protein